MRSSNESRSPAVQSYILDPSAQQQETPGANRGGRKGLIAGLILTALLAIVIYRAWPDEGFEWSRFVAIFRELKWSWIAVAAVFAQLTYVGRALRWQVMIRPQKPDASLWRLYVATAVGFTAIVFFGRAGEMVRPFLIAKKENVSFTSQVAAWLLERIYDLLMALLIFGFALSRVHGSGIAVGDKLQWVLQIGGHAVGVLATISLAIVFILRRYSDWMRERLLAALAFLPPHHLERVRGLVTAFTEGANSTRDTRGLVGVAVYSFLEWGFIVGTSVCVLRAFPALAEFTLTDVLIFVGFVSFGAVVQIPGVGGGLQLVAVIVLTELFKVPLETATGVAIAFWSITFLVIVPVGVLLALHDGIKWRNLKHIEIPPGAVGG
jgi:glycosyltransferase 2 family protein